MFWSLEPFTLLTMRSSGRRGGARGANAPSTGLEGDSNADQNSPHQAEYQAVPRNGLTCTAETSWVTTTTHRVWAWPFPLPPPAILCPRWLLHFPFLAGRQAAALTRDVPAPLCKKVGHDHFGQWQNISFIYTLYNLMQWISTVGHDPIFGGPCIWQSRLGYVTWLKTLLFLFVCFGGSTAAQYHFNRIPWYL